MTVLLRPDEESEGTPMTILMHLISCLWLLLALAALHRFAGRLATLTALAGRFSASRFTAAGRFNGIAAFVSNDTTMNRQRALNVPEPLCHQNHEFTILLV